MMRALSTWIGRFVLGSLMAMFAATAIPLLGWQVQRMERSTYLAIMRRSGIGRRAAVERFRTSKDFVDMAAPVALVEVAHPLRSMWRHVTIGVRALVAFGLLLGPLGAIFALAWWGGWNNSFYKGYENAAYGPLSFMVALALALPLLALHQMAQPHFAAQKRIGAMVDWGQLLAMLSVVPLRSLGHILLVIVLCLPVFGFRSLPVFAEGIAPELVHATPAELEAVRFGIIAVTGAYVFLASLWIRISAARIYGAALAKLAGQPGLAPSRAVRLADNLVPERARRAAWPGRTRCGLVLVVLSLVWVLLPAMVVVGQFMNINWMLWVNHPLVLLPSLPGG